jgi:hypothetical protein
VLHVLEALGGGTSRHVVDVVRHTPDVVHEVAIPKRRVGWVTDETAAEEMTAAGARIYRVEMRRSPASGRNAAALASLRWLIGDGVGEGTQRTRPLWGLLRHDAPGTGSPRGA